MSMDILLQGILTAAPQSRTSSKGNAYATALLRVPLSDSDAEQFSAIAFSSTAVEALLQRSKGDSIALSGSAQRKDFIDKSGAERKVGRLSRRPCCSSTTPARRTRRSARTQVAAEEPTRRRGPPDLVVLGYRPCLGRCDYCPEVVKNP